MESRNETVATAEVCPAGTAKSPVSTGPLWVQGLSQEVHPTVVVGVSVGEGVFANGLSGAGGPVGQFRRAEGRLGLESVPDPSTFHGFMRHRVTPTLRKAALATTLRLFRRRSRRGRRAFPGVRPATTP